MEETTSIFSSVNILDKQLCTNEMDWSSNVGRGDEMKGSFYGKLECLFRGGDYVADQYLVVAKWGQTGSEKETMRMFHVESFRNMMR
jgi:hypothetical protein